MYRHPDAPPGLGRLVIRAVLEDALSREECTTVMLQVCERNVIARELYERLGFTALQGDDPNQLYLRGKAGIRRAIDSIQNQL